MAFLSKIKSLKWKFYQGARVGPDTGVLTIYADNPDKKGSKYIIEIGWSIVHRQGEETKKLIRNVKHKITYNFVLEQEPDGNNIEKFVDTFEWQPLVIKTLPEDALLP